MKFRLRTNINPGYDRMYIQETIITSDCVFLLPRNTTARYVVASFYIVTDYKGTNQISYR